VVLEQRSKGLGNVHQLLSPLSSLKAAGKTCIKLFNGLHYDVFPDRHSLLTDCGKRY
jgi:hypothetical protein